MLRKQHSAVLTFVLAFTRFEHRLDRRKHRLDFRRSFVSGLRSSITSRCSGKEPALLPQRHDWTREDSLVSLSQSDNRPHIFVGHKLSRQFGLQDDVELINGMLKNFRDN